MARKPSLFVGLCMEGNHVHVHVFLNWHQMLKSPNVFYNHLGTEEERGIKGWRESLARDSAEQANDAREEVYHPSVYDLPFCGRQIHNAKRTRFIPFCSSYKGFPRCTSRCTCRQKADDIDNAVFSTRLWHHISLNIQWNLIINRGPGAEFFNWHAICVGIAGLGVFSGILGIGQGIFP